MVGGSMNHCPPRLTPKSARVAIHCHRVTAKTIGTNDAAIRRPAKMLIFLLSFTFCETADPQRRGDERADEHRAHDEGEALVLRVIQDVGDHVERRRVDQGHGRLVAEEEEVLHPHDAVREHLAGDREERLGWRRR